MATISEILKTLPKQDQDRLIYALQNQLPQFVRLPENRYIGVHVDGNKTLNADLKTDNGWSIGTVQSSNQGPQ